jgi:transposase
MGEGYEIILKLLEKYFGKRNAKTIVCLILMVFGITPTEIQKKQGAAFSTQRRYRKAIDNGNIESLFVVAERERQHSELDNYESKILADFERSSPKTLREAQTRIENLTGIKRSLRRLSVWLKKRGFVQGQ